MAYGSCVCRQGRSRLFWPYQAKIASCVVSTLAAVTGARYRSWRGVWRDTDAMGLPTGTVTLLFTDIVGSTALLHEIGDAYSEALDTHREALRAAFADHGGAEVGTQGDGFFVAFSRASDAFAAARQGQHALTDPVRVRMGLHTGEPQLAGDDYVGLDVHRAARIAAAANAGQVRAFAAHPRSARGRRRHVPGHPPAEGCRRDAPLPGWACRVPARQQPQPHQPAGRRSSIPSAATPPSRTS